MKNLKWTNGKGLVVFDEDYRNNRTMVNFARGAEVPDEADTFENCEFEDSLKYIGYEHGRSRVNLCFHSKKFDARVYMFMTDFDAMMQANAVEIVEGTIDATFTFVKRGSSYGIKVVL